LLRQQPARVSDCGSEARDGSSLDLQATAIAHAASV
jgi:hypothetical protein